MVPIANCKRCGRIFNRVRRDICMNCIQEEDKLIGVIRGYLKQHRDATIVNVMEDTGIEYATIVQMIREGRLLLRDNPNMTYPCERCENPTSSGRLCAKCAHELAQGLEGATEAIKEKSKQTEQGKGFFSR